MYARTLSNNISVESSRKSYGAAEESGLPSPVPIQPHSSKVCHQIPVLLICSFLRYLDKLLWFVIYILYLLHNHRYGVAEP